MFGVSPYVTNRTVIAQSHDTEWSSAATQLFLQWRLWWTQIDVELRPFERGGGRIRRKWKNLDEFLTVSGGRR